MARYYGYYSNVSREKRKKADIDDKVPCILEPELTDKAFRRNWARLIQKIYEVNPLICPKCQGRMRVVSFIEDSDVIRKILKHLNLWDLQRPPRPVAHAPRPKCSRHTTNTLYLPPMITSPIRFILWIPTSKQKSRRKLSRRSMPKFAQITRIYRWIPIDCSSCFR